MSVARFSCLFVVLSLTALVVADEAAKPALSPELQKLIQQLDADDFDERARASEQLAKLGKDALPALEEGVRSNSPEVATRSFDLLQQLFEKGDEAGKAAAKAALDRLAQGSDRVADQAKKMLEPKPVPMDPNDPTGRVRILGGGAIRIVGPRIARVAPIAPAIAEEAVVRKAMSISTTVGGDGVKTTTVDEDGKKVKIVEDPKKGIEGEYTETKDGKETTQKFAAKDADELKLKHPEAFKLYERFVMRGAAVRAEIAIAAGAPLAPRGVAPVALAPIGREKFEELLKKLEEQIASTTKELEISKADKDGREAVLTRKLESYARIRELYQRQIKELEAKELEVPKKPAEPKAEPAEIEVKDLKVEFEVK
jgi:hypothetical protein